MCCPSPRRRHDRWARWFPRLHSLPWKCGVRETGSGGHYGALFSCWLSFIVPRLSPRSPSLTRLLWNLKFRHANPFSPPPFNSFWVSLGSLIIVQMQDLRLFLRCCSSSVYVFPQQQSFHAITTRFRPQERTKNISLYATNGLSIKLCFTFCEKGCSHTVQILCVCVCVCVCVYGCENVYV